MALLLATAVPRAALAEASPLPVQRPVGEGTVDWTAGRVEVQGVAKPRTISPHTDWIESDLRTAAVERSVANLRTTIAAIPYDTSRAAGDLLDEAKLDALSAQAKETLLETLSDGTAVRRLWLPLELVRVALGGSPGASAAAPKADGDGDVLLIEARGHGLTPAVRMRVVDAAGAAVWSGRARYVSQRPRSLRGAPLLKLQGVQGARSTDARLDQASHERVHALEGPITAVWVVTESWPKP